MADKALGAARAAIGQGLGMGWGDEAEAWLRAKSGEGTYEQNLAKIRNEYGQYSKENPFVSGVAEFAGGAIPGVAAMMIPGGQGAGAAALQRSTMGALARLAAAGAATGAVSGAGSAKEGERGSGAVTGGAIGGTLGVAIPVGLRGSKGAYNWLRERLAPTESLIAQRAARTMTGALNEADLTPKDIELIMKADRAMNVPSRVANVNQALADLAETVAQRAGKGTRKIEKGLQEQRVGSRERAYQQTVKGLKPGQYYEDEQRMVKELRDSAKSIYDKAYAAGDVDDPRVSEVLKHPAFKGFFDKARQIADTEAMAAKLRGEDPAKYALPEIYKPSGKFDANGVEGLELVKLPDVRTLDYIKRGIDATIDSGFRGQGMSTAEASALRDLRKQFVNAIDENVPAYKEARKSYAGDMEVIEAMRAGLKDFGKLDHEQVVKMVAGMSQAEKEAFRTGVARSLYSKIMDPSGNFNAAQKIIGSPETQAKLQPLFDNAGQFNLFKNAMERESQLFHQSNRILGGSQTAKRGEMSKALDEESGVGAAIADAVTGGFWNSLMKLGANGIRNANLSEAKADKLAEMLMSKNPSEVAATVKLLEDYATKAAPRALKASAAEAGAVTGTASAVFPAPSAPEALPNIESDASYSGTPSTPGVALPDIEKDIEDEKKLPEVEVIGKPE
jgi:hypothetical protein